MSERVAFFAAGGLASKVASVVMPKGKLTAKAIVPTFNPAAPKCNASTVTGTYSLPPRSVLILQKQ